MLLRPKEIYKSATFYILDKLCIVYDAQGSYILSQDESIQYIIKHKIMCVYCVLNLKIHSYNASLLTFMEKKKFAWNKFFQHKQFAVKNFCIKKNLPESTQLFVTHESNIFIDSLKKLGLIVIGPIPFAIYGLYAIEKLAYIKENQIVLYCDKNNYIYSWIIKDSILHTFNSMHYTKAFATEDINEYTKGLGFNFEVLLIRAPTEQIYKEQMLEAEEHRRSGPPYIHNDSNTRSILQSYSEISSDPLLQPEQTRIIQVDHINMHNPMLALTIGGYNKIPAIALRYRLTSIALSLCFSAIYASTLFIKIPNKHEIFLLQEENSVMAKALSQAKIIGNVNPINVLLEITHLIHKIMVVENIAYKDNKMTIYGLVKASEIDMLRNVIASIENAVGVQNVIISSNLYSNDKKLFIATADKIKYTPIEVLINLADKHYK